MKIFAFLAAIAVLAGCADGSPCPECPARHICLDGRCVEPCVDHAGCSPAALCFEGHCQAVADVCDGGPSAPLGCTECSNNSGCDDGDTCNGAETCDGRRCTEGAPLDCDDDNPCTADTCDALAGCQNIEAAVMCDDGDPCTMNDFCTAGACSGDPTDADGDGFGPLSCGGSDCRDDLATVKPNAFEGPPLSATCADSLDNDCDGDVDAGDGGCTAMACGAVPSGGTEMRTMFATATVPFGAMCTSETQSRTCTNGVFGNWSGTHTFATCTVDQPADCTGPDLVVVPHGTSRPYFESATVPFTDTCVTQMRGCDNGMLSGTFTQPSCAPLAPEPYDELSVWELKGIHTDFWGNPQYPFITTMRDPMAEARDEIINNGLGVIGVNILWGEADTGRAPPCGLGEEVFDGRCFNVNPIIAEEIAYYSAQGIHITGILFGTPCWAREAACSPAGGGDHTCAVDNAPMGIFCATNPLFLPDWERFVRWAARRYDGQHGHGRVHDFVVHNEVNTNEWYDVGCGNGTACTMGTCGTSCDLTAWIARYADEFNIAYDAIVAIQPDARVMIPIQHYWDPGTWDRTLASPQGEPSISGATFLTQLKDLVGSRQWQLAFHPYPPILTQPGFGIDDFTNTGKVTFGNLGIVAGWLHATAPGTRTGLELHLTESGINGPPGLETEQAAYMCESLRNIVGTPGIRSHILNRMVDHQSEMLELGLRRFDSSAKSSWSTWALANRPGMNLDCGFENVHVDSGRTYVALRRGLNAMTTYHWATTRALPPGFAQEPVANWGLLRDPIDDAGVPIPDIKMLYEFQFNNHGYICDSPSCLGSALGPVGYIYTVSAPDRVAVHSCYITSNGDHYLNQGGCPVGVDEGALGYAKTW